MPPIYSKVNPADAPVLTIAVTSPSLQPIRLNDLTENRLAPKLSQVEGVGLVSIAGGQRPAVRIQANPQALASLGMSLDDVRSAIVAANVNQAKGSFDGSQRASTIDANDQLKSAAEYQNLVIAWKNGTPLRLRDVAQIVDDAENLRLAAWADVPCASSGENGRPHHSHSSVSITAVLSPAHRRPKPHVRSPMGTERFLFKDGLRRGRRRRSRGFRCCRVRR